MNYHKQLKTLKTLTILKTSANYMQKEITKYSRHIVNIVNFFLSKKANAIK